MHDEINQRNLEQELAVQLATILGYASPTNAITASIQANEFLEELHALAATKPAHFEQQKESVLRHAKLIGLSPRLMKALFVVYTTPR